MKNHTIPFLIVLLLVVICGCAGPVKRMMIRSSTEDLLLKAGFKPIPVTNKQEISLEGLPAGQITSIQRHGTIYYIYPDLTHDRLLMGKEENYARYHLLITQQLTPITQPSTQLDRDWASSGVWKN